MKRKREKKKKMGCGAKAGAGVGLTIVLVFSYFTASLYLERNGNGSTSAGNAGGAAEVEMLNPAETDALSSFATWAEAWASGSVLDSSRTFEPVAVMLPALALMSFMFTGVVPKQSSNHRVFFFFFFLARLVGLSHHRDCHRRVAFRIYNPCGSLAEA